MTKDTKHAPLRDFAFRVAHRTLTARVRENAIIALRDDNTHAEISALRAQRDELAAALRGLESAAMAAGGKLEEFQDASIVALQTLYGAAARARALLSKLDGAK